MPDQRYILLPLADAQSLLAHFRSTIGARPWATVERLARILATEETASAADRPSRFRAQLALVVASNFKQPTSGYDIKNAIEDHAHDSEFAEFGSETTSLVTGAEHALGIGPRNG